MNEQKGQEISIWIFDEIITKTHCSQCQNPLKNRWLTRKEQEKLIFDIPDTEFRNGSQLSQVEIYFCPKCGWEKPSLLCKDEFTDVPFAEEKQKYQKERELVEKIASVLLPQQSLKIRFVKSRFNQKKEIKLSKNAWVDDFHHPQREIDILNFSFCVEDFVWLEKDCPGVFLDTLAHEFAHADPEVFKNPQRNPKKNVYPNCSCRTTDIFFNPHGGDGHDKIWHDKYDEFRQRIKSENLAVGSDYVALGKDFMYEEPAASEEKNNQPEAIKQNQENKTNQSFSNILIIALIIGALAIFGGLAYWVAKKTKKVRSL